MRVLCRLEFSKRTLMAPVLLLVVTLRMFTISFYPLASMLTNLVVTFSGAVGMRIYGTTLAGNDIPRGPLQMGMNVLQVANQVFSFATNVSATSIITAMLW